ncbi:response regulator [bacterium]|nr:response regulator [bacterium]
METTAVRSTTLRVLHVEDDEDLFILIRGLLEPEGLRVTWSSNLGSARRELSGGAFDLVLLDHVLPDGNGLSFIEEIAWAAPEVPVIVLSARADESVALSSLDKGAANFVLKNEMRRDLIPAIEKVLGDRRTWVHRRIITDSLTPWMEPWHPPTTDPSPDRFLGRARMFYRTVLSSRREGCIIVDVDGVVTYVNEMMEAAFGCDAKHLLGGTPDEIFEEETSDRLAEVRSQFRSRRLPEPLRLTGSVRVDRGPAGIELVPVTITCRPIHGESGEYKACLMAIEDARIHGP